MLTLLQAIDSALDPCLLFNLPHELLLHVLAKCDADALGALEATCRRFHSAPFMHRGAEMAAHAAHGPRPVAFLYVAAAHRAHGPPSGPSKPALHEQLVCCTDPAGDDVLAGQASQSVSPLKFLKVFTPHAWQCPLLCR